MNLGTVSHIVTMPREIADEDTSFFQGFSPHLFGLYDQIFKAISAFPNDITEYLFSQRDRVEMRRLGLSFDVSQIRVDLLRIYPDILSRPFTVIWSTEKTVDECLEVVSGLEMAPIHVSTAETDFAVNVKDITVESVFDLIVNHAKNIVNSLGDGSSSDFLNKFTSSAKLDREIDEIPFPVKTHNCVLPLIDALWSLGIGLKKSEPMPARASIEPYVDEIENLVSFFDKTFYRDPGARFSSINDCIVYCPSMYAYLYKTNSKLWNELFREISGPERDFLRRMIIRNGGYGNASITVDGKAENLSDVLVSLVSERKRELSLFSQIVATAAASQMIPAVRLPNAAMLHHDVLRDIDKIIRRPNKKSLRNINKLLVRYNYQLKSDIGGVLEKLFLENRESLMAICDFPIEWLCTKGIPLMFQKEISRIPSSPGNLFSHLALSGQRIEVNSNRLFDVLIIRSFEDDDRIRDHLKVAVNHFEAEGCYKNLSVKIIDVTSEGEVVEALNNFNGLIVIFDCHGDHGGYEDHGWLNIGNDKMDSWTLANRCRVPPIVILSACSTNSISGSHASVANGFFRSGALSVIGTYAPIMADHAGLFVSRLLYRIAYFVPIVCKNRPLSWREIVSGFFRMSYMTDVLMGMEKDGFINGEQYRKLHVRANVLINSGTKNWFEGILKFFEDEFYIESAEVVNLIREKFQFVETMLFSQLGRPENIVVYDAEESSGAS